MADDHLIPVSSLPVNVNSTRKTNSPTGKRSPGSDESGLYQHSDLPADSPAFSPAKRQAAVLMPLVHTGTQWELLFIRRATKAGDRHSGQVAFPGGAREARDSDLTQTALRETHEEIGIVADRIQLVDALHPYVTVSRFDVTPIVGIMDWPCEFTLEPSEVARVFSIPVAWLYQRNNFEIRDYQRPPTPEDPTPRTHPVIYFERFKGEQLWGASARMTLNLFKALDDGTLMVPGMPWPPEPPAPG